MIHHISAEYLTVDRVREILENNIKIDLSEDAKKRIVRCREYLDNKMETQKEPIYGITTGFGSLCNISIDKDQLAVAEEPGDVACLRYGRARSCRDREADAAAQDPVPFVRQFGRAARNRTASGRFLQQRRAAGRVPAGSLGASGDLAPLANMCLPLLGLGEVEYKGARRPSDEVLKEFGWKPISLQSKEGLALLNGTQFMSAFGVYSLIKARRLSEWADLIGAMSLDAFDGRINPFIDEVHEIRAHKGQLTTARNFRRLLEGSEMIARPKKHVQDPYSFRCIPQVHGASKDTIDYVGGVLETEINSPTDNPTIFPEKDIIVSAGNFHGQPIALAMDFLAIAVAELGNISERRIYKLISGARELPSFLVAKPGLNSGFMIPQYAAASIVSQSKGLCWPASCDSIPSSQGQEDHVSMGSNAATKLYRVVLNTERVLAIELLNAAQALEFRRPLRSSKPIEDLLAAYRKHVPFVENDQVMYTLIDASVKFLQTEKL